MQNRNALEQIQFLLRHLLLQARTGFRAASRVVGAVVQFNGNCKAAGRKLWPR
jgi:hypothetical protein